MYSINPELQSQLELTNNNWVKEAVSYSLIEGIKGRLYRVVSLKDTSTYDYKIANNVFIKHFRILSYRGKEYKELSGLQFLHEESYVCKSAHDICYVLKTVDVDSNVIIHLIHNDGPVYSIMKCQLISSFVYNYNSVTKPLMSACSDFSE